MVNIYDLAAPEVWADAFTRKHINKQSHPTLPYDIYDYSQICQFERAWNNATLASRGLIVQRETGDIVSRPLGKFFNYNEPSVPTDLLSGRVVVTDKADGSMGVSYLNSETGQLNISTRGSFTSEQALHATALYLDRYDGKWEPLAGHTYVWEIIYPQNRIVINYGDKDDLVLIARVNIETGVSVPASEVPEWKWEKVEQFPYQSLTEALNAPSRKNAEGFVVHYVDTDVRVKIKQEDYIHLHRIITGASSRRIWEVLATGGDFTEWLTGLPEEFTEFVETTRDKLIAEHQAVLDEVETTYNSIIASLPEGFSQKEFAAEVMKAPKLLQGMLFTRHSGGHYNEKAAQKNSDIAWRHVQPEFEKPFWNLNGKVD